MNGVPVYFQSHVEFYAFVNSTKLAKFQSIATFSLKWSRFNLPKAVLLIRRELCFEAAFASTPSTLAISHCSERFCAA